MMIVSAAEVRSAIASHILGMRSPADALGEITLHPHQRDGVDRLLKLLDSRGGALLADDVGLGKTFIALAVARESRARDVLVVAPAALREGWIDSARRAAVILRFVSVEMLGRRGAPQGTPDLVIVDEAHHLRSSRTRRFTAASALCRGSKVLLLTATPVQNRLSDLRTLLSLFLGERAHAVSADDLGTWIVRRVESDLSPTASLELPRVRPPEWVRAVTDADCLDRLLALPSPVPPADGDDGGVLLTYSLVRQWASSRAALRSALQRRVARAHAMEDALLAGRLPSRAELTSWCFADGAQQLAFPELTTHSAVADATHLLTQVRLHAGEARKLMAWLETSADPDVARAAALGDIMRGHPGERVIAFSEFAETVASLYRNLAPTARVAMLTHTGGRVAGGPLTRRDVLARFAPGASLRARASERIDLLITTDVLSEGVNLQDASVVVHLDLAWNPARLEQRVGRLRRIGAARPLIAAYMFAPPVPVERLLQLEQRLRHKLNVAARSVGVAGAILPGFLPSDVREATAPREERIAETVRSWRGTTPAPVGAPVAAAVRSSKNGALACVRSGADVSLIALREGHVTDSRAVVQELVACADGEDAEISPADVRMLRERVERWLRERNVSHVVDLSALRIAHSRRALLHRVDTIARRAPRHAQPQFAPLMHAARTAATATLSAGAERVLDELARAPMNDEAWLHAVGEFASLHARASETQAPEILALLVLRSS